MEGKYLTIFITFFCSLSRSITVLASNSCRASLTCAGTIDPEPVNDLGIKSLNPNVQRGIGAEILTMAGNADNGIERTRTAPDDSGRNPRESGIGASNIAARTGDSYPEPSRMMEAVVERENMYLDALVFISLQSFRRKLQCAA